MHLSIFTLAICTITLVTAHGKVSVVTGDAGGNGTALGIQGGIIPGAGSNKVTEPDTTVFQGKNANGCGRTTGKGANTIQAGTHAAMALSGNILPQVSVTNGSISGTLHIVTSDGAGPYKALLDKSGTGDFSKAVTLKVLTQVPGTNGNIKKKKTARGLWTRLFERTGLVKRATNINEDFPFSFAVPDGTVCTGSVAGQNGVCMVKVVNPSGAGPFGGCVPLQIVANKARRAIEFES